jgi:methionyl-tRNA formyltransferase
MNNKYGVLASGNLGLIILEKIFELYKLSFVFTDSKSDGIISFCNNNKIPLFVGNPRNGKSSSFLKDHECDVILSVNYLFIVEEDIINHPIK